LAVAVRDWWVAAHDVAEEAAHEHAPGAEHPVLELQRTAGNRAVTALVVQRRAEDEGTATRSAIDSAISGSGQALPAPLRSRAEAHLSADLSGVRIHTGAAAARSASAVAAESYTVGNDVVFGAGQYDPSSSRGQHLIAHELTHVVQQRQGPVSGSQIGGGVAVSDPGDRFERAAEASAAAFVQRRSDDSHTHSAGCGHNHEHAPAHQHGGRSAGGAVQRSTISVQRHSSFEHKLIGDLTPEQLSAIGAHQDLAKKGGKKQIDLPNGSIDRDEVLHVLEQEIRRLTYFQSNPPRGNVKDIKSETKRMQEQDSHDSPDILDDKWDLHLVSIPTRDGGSFLITYGEMNTLADFFGNPKELLGMEPAFIDKIIRGIRQDSLKQMIKMYATTKDKYEWQVRRELGVKSTKFLSDEGKNDAQGTTGVINELKLLGIGSKGKPLANKEDKSTSYGSTLARNACHFAPESWHQWFAYHTKARDLARQAFEKRESADRVTRLTGDPEAGQRVRDRADELLNMAMLENGFGDHYLQDSYAGGHLINKTKIMQWYVKWLDKQPGLMDFHKDSNWRKAQDIAYGQDNLVSNKQYDKKNVKASVQDDGRTKSSAQNPQAAHNYGEDWREEAEVLGLEVPSSIASNTPSRQLLIRWMKACATSSRNQIKTVDALAKMMKMSVNTTIGDLGPLMADGIVRFDSYSTGDRRKGERIIDILRPGSLLRLRDEYKPKNSATLKQVNPESTGSDDAFNDMALAVQYREYKEFLNSSFIQKSTNDLHNKFCKEGLDVKSGEGTQVFKVYGDENMFNQGAAAGLQHSGETAKMSRDNIVAIGTGGKQKDTSEAILNRLPASVVLDGTEMTLADWHTEGGPLQRLCETKVFPKANAVTAKLAPGVISKELGTISKNPHPEQGF
jgi:hypothetical protein